MELKALKVSNYLFTHGDVKNNIQTLEIYKVHNVKFVYLPYEYIINISVMDYLNNGEFE